MKRFTLAAALMSVLFSGCLQTRNSYKESEEKQVMQKQVQSLQQMTADVRAKFQDVEEDDRKMNGRIEAIEYRVNQLSQKAETGDQTSNERVKQMQEKLAAYQEAISKLDNEVNELKAQVSQLQAGGARGGSTSGAPKTADTFSEAEALFKAGNFREAILEYEKYRKSAPKGKQVAESTYKIGVCFQELNMPEEAKAFYEEVVARFPKTKEADRANYRIKSLKKK